MSLQNLSNFKNILNDRVDEFLMKISGKDKVLLKSLKKDWENFENFESEKSLDREKIPSEINYCRYKFVMLGCLSFESLQRRKRIDHHQ